MTEAPLIDERARFRTGVIAVFLIVTIFGSVALTVDVPAGGSRTT